MADRIQHSTFSIQNSTFWYIPAGWWLLWSMVHAWILNGMGVSLEMAVTDSLVHNITLAILCTGCFLAMRYTRPTLARFLFALTGLAILALTWTWLCSQVMEMLQPEIINFAILREESNQLRVVVGWLMMALFTVLGWMFYYLQEHSAELLRKEEIKRLSNESELLALRYQMHPHFIFNTLNSISALAVTDGLAARNMIGKLSEFLRSTLKKDIRELVPFSEELAQLELYIDIEKVRFGHRLQFESKIDPDCGQISVPALVLQPLAENAIKYGLYDTLGPVTVRLEAKPVAGIFMISFTNPYDLHAQTQVQGTGFGLDALSRRLNLFYGRNDLLTTSGKDGIFTATLRIPFNT